MTDVRTELPAGVCVCGRDIPDTSPSDWACGEPCQSAWLMHQSNPDYPHPREIREAAEARTARRMDRPVEPPTLPAVPEGTEIDVDGTGFVRVGVHWQQTGPWSPLDNELAAVLEYRRWCPGCNRRCPYDVDNDPTSQVCRQCRYRWPGRVLVGVVETRGEPWPGIRLRLTDGYRSAGHMFTEDWLAAMAARNQPVAEILAAYWVKAERALAADGRNDQDRAEHRRPRAPHRGQARWDWAEL